MSRETRIAKFPASLVCAAVIVSAVLGGPIAWASGWEAVYGATDWSPRAWHQTTYFNGSYYLTGGSNGSSTIGGLWQSNDGNYWTPLIADDGNDVEREVIEGHSAVTFDGKLWALGGTSPYSYNDTIRYLNQPDPAISQFALQASAPWGTRKFGQAVAFAGKLWFIGGFDGSSTFFNDVWSSPDGLNWTQETASAAWSARAGHSVVTDGSTMYLMGGWNGVSTFNDVWASTDGISWVMVTPAAPWAVRTFAGAAYLNGIIYIAGGGPDAATTYNDVWSSTDGTTWTQETANAPWPARFGVGMATNGTELLLTGGANNTQSYNDTWASTDGVTWTQRGTSLAPAPWDDGVPTNPAVVSRSVRFGADLFLFFRDEIWSTPDGTNWTLEGTNPWGETTGQIIEFNGKLWHLTATSSWSSMDGVNWTAGAAPPWPQTEAFSAAVFQGKLWVFGGYLPGGGPVTTYSNELWSTSDGVTWTLMPAVPAGLGGRANPGFVSYGGRLWIIGGDLQYGPAIETWFSPD
ncbi:MAG: hypothetical protein KJ060_03490, partial [Candidatus Hydrogenedentes bacterium]|nr:hypothetical protein [Candidatus Hydrogenedentota bacterium]